MSFLRPIAMLMLVLISVSIAQAHTTTFQNYELSIFGSFWQAIVHFFGSLFGSSNTATSSTTTVPQSSTTSALTTTIPQTTSIPETTVANGQSTIPTTSSSTTITSSTSSTTTSSQTTTNYTNSYLSHPICSPINNTTSSYPDNVTCPSSCPYASTTYYEGNYPNGAPVIQTAPVGQHVCLYSPVTTTSTSTITTSSTTTIPQTKYYHLNIIRTPNLSLQTKIGTFVFCYPNPQPGNNYSEQANSQVNLFAPSSCVLPQTGVNYYFSKWRGSGSGSVNTTNNSAIITMRGNITETAYYMSTTTTIPSTTTTIIPSTTTISNSKPTYYTLKVMTNGGDGGIVSQLGNGTYINGSEVRISAIPSKGYVFGGWMCIIGNVTSLQGQLGVVCKNIGYSGNSPNATITINSNITEIAFFGPQTPKQYQLTINSNPSNIGQAGVSGTWWEYLPKSSSYVNNTELTIYPLNIYSGWAFTGWSCMGTGCYSGNFYLVNITLNNNITETENFAPIYYTLNEKILNPGVNCGRVSQSGNGTYRAGSSVTISATPTQVYPAYGCEFEAWVCTLGNTPPAQGPGCGSGIGYSGNSSIANIVLNSDITETGVWAYRPRYNGS